MSPPPRKRTEAEWRAKYAQAREQIARARQNGLLPPVDEDGDE